MEQKQEYIMEEDEEPIEPIATISDDSTNQKSKILSDMYDVYAKASNVHSKLTDMSADYVLARYNIDVYNQKLPKFIREQRKIVRIIKSYLVVPLEKLLTYYNNEETAVKVYQSLLDEYNIIEELLIGELDENVIMTRGLNGEVITAFLQHGMNPEVREEYMNRNQKETVGSKLQAERR